MQGLTNYPHKVKNGCLCENCAKGRAEDIRRKMVENTDQAKRLSARTNLARRRDRVDTGLSNPAYLHAARSVLISGREAGKELEVACSAGRRLEPAQLDLALSPALESGPMAVPRLDASQLRVELGLARVAFRFSDALTDHMTPGAGASGTLRGSIREMSEASRGRLASAAYTLTEEGQVPACMITLTSPGNWEDVYLDQAEAGGVIFKGHLRAFRMRLQRKLELEGISEHKVLWFLEFQKRGAPHVHLMLFGLVVGAKLRRELRKWCGVAWSEVVGNPSEFEQAKHRRVGTQVSKMRVNHFGYATKYATKTEQKRVPDEFAQVGRFWGLWNHKLPKPDTLVFDFVHTDVRDAAYIRGLVEVALNSVRQHSLGFCNYVMGKVDKILDKGVRMSSGFAVFGAAARGAVEILVCASFDGEVTA